MKIARAFRFVVLVSALGLAFAACGGGSGGGPGSSPSAAAGGGTPSLTIQGFAFSPDTLTAPAGDRVRIAITNEDSTTHSFTLDDGGATADVPPGQTVRVSVTWPASGSVGFHCRFHPSMTGTLAVA